MGAWSSERSSRCASCCWCAAGCPSSAAGWTSARRTTTRRASRSGSSRRRARRSRARRVPSGASARGRARRSTPSAGCCATSRAGTPTCTAASSSRPTTTAPTSACCSGTRTATRRPAGTGRSRSAPGRWRPAASRRPSDGEADVTIDVPSGRVVARVRRARRRRGGRSPSATCPRSSIARGVRGRPASTVDVAYGGAIYASSPAARFGLRVDPEDLGGADRRRAGGQGRARGHRRRPPPRATSGSRASTGRSSTRSSATRCHQRNVTIFADGEVDRSPCGSGTSARCALLAADGAPGARARSLAPRLDRRHDVPRARARATAASGVLDRGRGHGLPHRRAPLRRSTRATRSGTGFVLR